MAYEDGEWESIGDEQFRQRKLFGLEWFVSAAKELHLASSI